MSADQAAAVPPPVRFRPEVCALAYRMLDAVKGSFETAPGPLFAEATIYATSLLLLMTARPGCGSNLLRGGASILADMSKDAAAVEALREFMARGRAAN